MSIPASLTTMAICQIIITAGLVLTLGALIFAIFAIKNMISKKIDEAMSKVQPLMDQAKTIAEQAKGTAENISSKLDSIAAKAEDAAGKMTDRVQAVSDRVEEASGSPQVATIAGVAGAALRFYQIYSEMRKAQVPTPTVEEVRRRRTVVVETTPDVEVPASI